jgi:predicted dehydrogenase
MTDWGVHLIDPLHQCFGEVMPASISALGAKFYVQDNVEAPDTLLATFQYPKFLASYESRTCNSAPMFGQGYGSSIHGTEATLVLNRGGCWVTPTKDSKVTPVSYEKNADMAAMNVPHWQNFIACIKSRQRPTSDIETCVRSSTACILANLSMRFKTRLEWDEANWTVMQEEIRPHLKYQYRAPWKLDV